MPKKSKIVGLIIAVVSTFFFTYFLIDRNRESKASEFSDNITLEEKPSTTTNFLTENDQKLADKEPQGEVQSYGLDDQNSSDNDQVPGTQDNWWDYDSTTQVLTIHSHELNAATDTVRGFWPWHAYPYSNMKKIVIESGVTAKGSIAGIFRYVSLCKWKLYVK